MKDKFKESMECTAANGEMEKFHLHSATKRGGDILMEREKILVIMDKKGRESYYVISWLVECWVDAGYEVEYTFDLDTRQKADIAILHVDLTEIPEKYHTYAKRFPVVINAGNNSIGKDLFSHMALTWPTSYDGKVIVKTKLNFGGMPELSNSLWIKRKFFQLVSDAAMSGTVSSPLLKSLAWKRLLTINPSKYPIFDSVDDVPRAAWKNPNLIIEKFLPEQEEDGRYVLRHWYFFGSKEFRIKLVCKNPIPKWINMDSEEQSQSSKDWFDIEVLDDAELPDEVRAVRERLKMDYGRLDWVFHNGKPVVFDANKTPGATGVMDRTTELGRHRYAVMQAFSKGIEKYLPSKIYKKEVG